MIRLQEKPPKTYNFKFLQRYFEQESIQENKEEKKLRCQNYQQENEIPNSFKENSYKEQLILENIKQFEKNFKNEFPDRKLLLSPINECDTEKFISTTIRPTKLKYKCLSDYDSCIKFFANFITYEELEDPICPPEIIPSPYNVLKWQIGDSLDIAILVTSFLIGSGYDAYVMMGRANKEVTTRDESQLDCPFLEQKTENIEMQKNMKTEKEIKNIFFIEKPQLIESEIDKTKNNEKIKISENEIKLNQINDNEPERPSEDILLGQRQHFWIMILQNKERKVKDSIFINPASCTTWLINSENLPFSQIEQIINHRNVWINASPERSIKRLNLDDFKKQSHFLPVLQNNQKDLEIKNKENLYNDQEQKFDIKLEHIKQLLDRPISWVPKLEIERESFQKNLKNDQHSRFYKKLQIDFYSEFKQPDGLVKKITIFQDYKRLLVKEITLYYKNRRDNLYMKKHYPYEFRTIDYYKNNQQINQQNNNWPHWREIETISSVKRIIRFYPLRFNDGLIEREEIIGEKTIERYQNRDDKLIYSSVRFEKREKDFKKDVYSFKDRNIGQVIIVKMVQKFEKNMIGNANDQISKLTVDLKRQKIFVFYHLNDHEISPIEYVICRSLFTGMTPSLNKFNNDLSIDKTRQIYTLEKECYSKIKYGELTVEEDFQKYKYAIEEKIMQIQEGKTPEKNEDEFSILIRNTYIKKNNKQRSEIMEEMKEDDYIDKNDIIGQILKEKGLEGKKLDEKTQENIKKEIIYNLQNRYIERSEIINQRFEEEKNKVVSLQKKFQRKANENIDKDEEKAFEDELYHFNLKLGILEQRLFNFQKTAYEKYEDLQKKLNKDPRLNQIQFQLLQ